MSNKLNEKNNNINNIKILSVKDFSYKPDYPNLSYKIPQDILYNNYKENEDKNNNDANLSLIHSIENSLINKDYDTFLWCLQQENKEIIIESVKKMNRDTIEMFFEKVIDLFQSNNFYKKNVVIWIIEIFKYHKFEILSMENKIIKNLNIIKNYISNYTKNYNNLIRIQEKLNIINKYKNNNNIQENKNINNENNLIKNNNNPLLTYMESDDEEEIEKNKNKIKKLKEKGFEEVDSDNKSNNNENEMDIDEEDKIDNEEENDFDIDEDSNEESIQSEENVFKNKKKKNITNEEDEEEEEEEENN